MSVVANSVRLSAACEQRSRSDPARLPNEIDPASVRFTQTPDILFILIESLRADFLDMGGAFDSRPQSSIEVAPTQ